MRRILSSALGVLALAGTASAETSETALWKSVGPWQIRVDDSLNNGCFMFANYSGLSSTLRIGFDDKDDMAYISFGNPNWKSLQNGNDYTVSVQVDDLPASSWTGFATHMGNLPVLNFPVHKTVELWKTLAGGWQLKLDYNGNHLGTFNLNGTGPAVLALLDCEKQFGHNPFGAQNASDPFGSSQNSDPFRSSQSSDPFKQ